MLTLRDLKRIVAQPARGDRVPTGKSLKETETPVISKCVGEETKITVYPNGYALYQVYGHTTVFPIRPCRDYLYVSGENGIHIPESFFDQEPWYLRLILEGEDRIRKNQDKKEQARTIPYGSVSEEWEAIADPKESALDHLIRQEAMEEIRQSLTHRQHMVLQAFFLQEKTQEQISKEMNLSKATVYFTIFQAKSRMREKYLADGQLPGDGICSGDKTAYGVKFCRHGGGAVQGQPDAAGRGR